MEWCICSTPFNVTNGVKQEGIVSPLLFCIYLDGLLLALRDSKVGCYVGALAYADDVTLLAPTARAMRIQLKICDEYSEKFRIVFNATKSACMVVGKKVRHWPDSGKYFSINGTNISLVKEYCHLGHIITADLDGKTELISKRNLLCGKINNVLCYFKNCDHFVKIKLLRHYCYDFYGSNLWNLAHNNIEDICIAWRKGLRRTIWNLPARTHCIPRGKSGLTDMVCCKRLLYMVGFLRLPATTSGWTTLPTGYCNSEIQDGVQDGRHVLKFPYYHRLLFFYAQYIVSMVFYGFRGQGIYL